MAGAESPSADDPNSVGEPDLETAYASIKQKPCKVGRVRIDGLQRTDGTLVEREFDEVRAAQSLEEVNAALMEALGELMAMDVFDGVEMIVDQSDKVWGGWVLDVVRQQLSPGTYSFRSLRRAIITVTLLSLSKRKDFSACKAGRTCKAERVRIWFTLLCCQELLGLSAHAHDVLLIHSFAAGTVEASASLINPLGHGERFAAKVEYGTQRSNNFSLVYSKPRRIFGYHASGDVRVHQVFHDCERWSSYTELLRGGAAGITRLVCCKLRTPMSPTHLNCVLSWLCSADGRNSLSYDLAWRRLADPSRLASHAVMNQLGDQLKSAVKHIFLDSTLDNPLFPTTGQAVRMETELSGLGPDSNLLRFVKQHVTGLVAFPVGDSAALTLSGEAGIMLPWGAGALARSTSISDRFYLGGIGSLRGFQTKGVGPCAPRRSGSAVQSAGDGSPRPTVPTVDSLGGDIVLGGAAALNFQLPNEALRSAGIYGQLFINGGSLAPLAGGPVRDSLRQFSTSFRWSMVG
jgi:hypothetical protein